MTTGTTGRMHPPIGSIVVFRVDGQFVIIFRLFADANFNLIGSKVMSKHFAACWGLGDGPTNPVLSAAKLQNAFFVAPFETNSANYTAVVAQATRYTSIQVLAPMVDNDATPADLSTPGSTLTPPTPVPTPSAWLEDKRNVVNKDDDSSRVPVLIGIVGTLVFVCCLFGAVWYNQRGPRHNTKSAQLDHAEPEAPLSSNIT